MLLLAQTISLNLGNAVALATIAGTAVGIVVGAIRLLEKFVDSRVRAKRSPRSSNESMGDERPALPTAAVLQNVACMAQHNELLSKMGNFSEATQQALQRMANSVDALAESTRRSFEAVSMRQIEIKTKVEAIHEQMPR